jgi:hypothetical protein
MITAAQYAGKYEQIGTDTYRVLVQLTDDVAGVSTKWFDAHGATATAIRDDVSRQIAALNDLKSIKSVLDGIANGTNIPVVAPAAPGPPAPTAQQQYFANVARLIHLKQLIDAGGLDPATKEVTDLQASLKAAYQSGYAAAF